MSEFLRFLFIGLGVGAVYALAAQGIVLVYRGSGVLNFAHGAIALVAASVFTSVRPGVGAPLACLASVALAATIGAVIDVAVMRPLRNASPVVRLIATLGLLTVLSQAVLLRYGDSPRFTPALLPVDSWTLPGDVTVGIDRLGLTAVAVVVTVALWALYTFTQFGRATVGVAENERAVAALGWSPQLVSAVNWSAGAALAGLAGVLFAPITSVNSMVLTLLVLPALAAALVGGFRSFPLTLAGGLLIGVVEAVLTRYVRTPGWPSVTPLLIIIVVLVARGHALPLRSHVLDRLPRTGTGRINPPALIAAVVAAGAATAAFTDNFADAVTTSMAAALIVLSLVVITGYCGQLSIAQYALAGFGALVSSRLADAWGVPFPVAAAVGVLATVPVGLLIAVPALRTRGVNLAIATLGLALAIEKLVLGNPSYTGGAVRGTILPSPTIFGWSVDALAHPKRYAAVATAAFVVAAVLVANLRRGRAGRRLLAVRSNERAAAALGISSVEAKLYAFALSAALAAVGGVLLAFRFEHVLFDQFNVLHSIDIILYAVIGGIGFVSGAAVGALLAAGGVSDHIVGHFIDPSRWITFIAGCIVVVMIVPRPDGAAGQVAGWLAALRSRRRDRSVDAVLLGGGQRTRKPPLALHVEGVTVRFGGVLAVEGAGLRVEPGTVVGLIGPNGAGKTTLIDAITGFVTPKEGSIRLGDERIDAWSARRRAAAGLGRSFQSLELFEEMTVLDNLRTASDPRDRAAYLADLVRPGSPPLPPLAVAAVEEFGLRDDLLRLPSELPYGRRRLVALARAVAMGPSVLLLDEPAAGLDAAEAREIASLIRRLADEWGIGILLIEHDVDLVMRVCDHVVALDFGRVIAQGTPAEIRSNADVVAAYLGAEVDGEPLPAGGAKEAR